MNAQILNATNIYTPAVSTQGLTLPICYRQSREYNFQDISHLEGHSNYTLFYFNNGTKLLVSKTMKEYEELLNDSFVRIHKKFVINIQHLIHFDIKSDMCVLLKNGKKLNISRRRKKEFLVKVRNTFGNLFC
jgi:two-component system, LytTR family, response regulator